MDPHDEFKGFIAPDDKKEEDDFTLGCIINTYLRHGPQNGIRAERRNPTSNMGLFDVLPTEIQQEILSQLDVQMLENFRRINRRAMQLVESLRLYKIVIEHARNALCAIVSTGAGRWLNLSHLYDKLCTPTCEICGDFGEFLYIITCRRVCYLCFTTHADFQPLQLQRDELKMRFCISVSEKDLEMLPNMKTLPGRYSEGRLPVSGDGILIDYPALRELVIVRNGSVDEVGRKTNYLQFYMSQKRLFANSIMQPHHRSAYNQYGVQDAHRCDWRRFAAIVRTPCLDAPSGKIEEGFSCVGCCSRLWPVHEWRRIYTRSSFREHLKEFGPIDVNRKNKRHARRVEIYW
ncbi:hypothetical protein ABW19_dt0202073 [Dactylella cylindrospora]|nr:hypothetical protein ABW19_dt0202073 [Dactylella cylindrospora]